MECIPPSKKIRQKIGELATLACLFLLAGVPAHSACLVGVDLSLATGHSDSARPYVIGYFRGEDGKLQALFSDSPRLHSLRQLGSELRMFAGWSSERRIEKISVDIVGMPGGRVGARTADFDLLPRELRALFEFGKTLVTRSSSASGDSRGDYSVLMAAAPDVNGSEGRTGVLLFQGQPLKVTRDGKEYLVELKGVGHPSGGYDYNYRSRRGTIRGGTDEASALHEFEMINRERPTVGGNHEDVLAPLVVSFDSPNGRQGMLVRLVPGTIRASFGENSALASLNASGKVDLAKSFGRIYGNFMSQGLVPTSHLENLIVTEAGKSHVPTDYADIHLIREFPDGERDPRTIAIASLRALAEMPGYDPEIHFKPFRKTFAQSLLRSGQVGIEVIREISKAKTFDEIGSLMWRRYLALSYFRQKKLSVAPPEAISEGATLEFNFESLTSRRDARKRELAYEAPRLVREKEYGESDFLTYLIKHVKTLRTEVEFLDKITQTPQTALAVLRSKEFRDFFWTGRKAPENEGFSAIYLDELERVPKILGHRLLTEVSFLLEAKALASGNEAKEIEKNIEVANARLKELHQLGPLEFAEKVAADPDYLRRMSILPYQSNAEEAKGGH